MLAKNSVSRRFAFIMMALIVTLCAIAATAYTLWRLRAEAIHRHFDAASMYARAFEDHLTQSFNVIDLSLISTFSSADDKVWTADALAAALSHAPYLRSLGLLDAKSRIVASSDPRNIGVRINRADFLPPTSGPRAILRAGPPWSGRDFHNGRAATPEQPAAADAQSLIPLLREIALGQDAWVTLLASVNSDYFLNYYSRSLAAEAGVVELLRYDGMLLLSTDPKQTPGSINNADEIPPRVAIKEFGRFEQQLANGSAVLTAYRASRAYPFLIVVHLDKEYGLVGWRGEAVRTLIVVALVLLAALGLASLYLVRMERAARQHDADLEQLRLLDAALRASANAIIITDRSGTIEWANPAFCSLSGYAMSETLGHNSRELIKSSRQTPNDYQDLWQTIVAGRVWRGELINRRKDNTHYLEGQTITPVRDQDGNISHFIAVKQDITERRQSEKRMEELSRHLVVVQESARRRLSGELHDRTSPNLAAIGVNLDIICATMLAGQTPILSERIEDVRALVEDTTASIREICSDLRPPVLDYAGLAAALESYVRQFQRRTSIEVRIDCAHPATRLAPDLESVLFRIVQEALTNCAKHSRARSITVSLKLDARPVVLTLCDDGVGFDPDLLGKTTHTSGLGILTMREMAEFSGGKFTLDSRPDQGTRITVEIDPMKGRE